MNKTSGFTLIEIIVVVAIISILSGAMLVNIAQSGRQSRDIDRAGDLKTLQSALELYKQRYNRYPPACNGPMVWSGQIGTDFECSDGTGKYIQGLAPEFISVLPRDPRLNGTNSGYAYLTDADGAVYKLIAFNTVESEVVTGTHPLRYCDNDGASVNDICAATDPAGTWSGNVATYCVPSDDSYQTSYGVWGGYARRFTDSEVNRFTEEVICRTPLDP
jgi:prepilin-type N-terminal cleavage/methylation domain-containing protein